MSVFPKHADTLLRLGRSLSAKNDSGELAKISLSKFYWRGKDAHTAEYDEKKLYGLVGVGAYIVMCGDDRSGYLEEFLRIIADIPCIVNEPIFGMHDTVDMEKICFCIGLIVTDIYNLFPAYQAQVLTTVASILSSYHKILIKNEDEANISMVSIPALFGFLRSLFRMKNSVKRLIPLPIAAKRTEQDTEEVNLDHFFSYPERQLPLEDFKVNEEKSLIVATIGLYDFFASGSNDVNDLGLIQLSHFFTRCSASPSDQEELTKMSKKALDSYISSVNAIRQDNDDSSNLKLSRIQRQLHCISACCFLSVRTVRTDECATGILQKIVARLLGNDPTALCLIAVGLFHDLLSAVGELTSYHPSIKDQAVKAIRDFLLTPAPVLIKLNKASKKGEYQQLRENAIRTFKIICSCGENNENEQVGVLCSKIHSISINNTSGSLAMDHLFALLTTFVTEKSDSQLKVFTTIHNTHSMKSGLHLEKECILHLTDLSIKIAEKSPPEDSKGENMAAEIIEIIIQSYMSAKATSGRATALTCLEKLATNAKGHHKLWLLSRYLKVFFLLATENKSDDRIAPVMACIASILSKEAPDWNDPQLSSLRNSMRDFWFYCAVFGFSDMSIGWPEKFRANIMDIAKRSPTLSFLANEPVKQTLENNPALKKGSSGSSIKEVQDLKLALSHSIGSRDMQLDGEIKALDYVNVLYHIAVLHIERLRLASYLASDPKKYEYQELFTYIENQMVQRSKQAKDKILKEILITIYREYLSAIRDFATTINIDTCLVEKVQLLLIKFNSTNSTSRYIADSNLLVTFNYFEHLVWQPAIIETELDIVQQLSFSLEDAEDSFQEAHELSIPSINISLKLPDSLEKRQSMVLAMQRYLLEKPGILRRALEKAPRATKSHIAEYLRSKDEKDQEVHANTHLLFSNARITAKDLNFSKRSKVFGEAALLIDIVEDPVSEIISKYDKVNMSDNGKNRHKLEEHMYQMTALILQKEKISEESKRRLLRKISWAIIDTFHVQIVEAAIYCWQWISSARPEMDEVIMLEIASVWQCTIEKKLGIFEPAHSEGNVLAFLESDPPCPNPPNIAPHLAWVRFLQEMLASFKLTKTGPCRTILSLLNGTLSSSVAGSADHIITRHVNSAAVRMELISLGFSILHSQVLIREVERSVLRAKLYNSLFDYFSTPSSLPVMPRAQLKEDIDALIRFVQIMNKEGKRIADPLSGVAGVSYSTTGSTKESMSGTESLRRGDMASTAGSTLTPKSLIAANGVRHLVDNYKRKRQFALQLLVTEIERFKIWLQPQPQPQYDESDRFMQFAEAFSLDKLVDKQWKQLAKDGWSISPFLACQLPSRLKQEPALLQELIRLVQENPQIAHEIPEAVSLFITPEFIRSDGKDLSYLLFWKSTDPATALGLFSQRFKPHSYTAQYSVRCLRSFQEEQILFYIPQLVQALRYDSIGYVAEYLLAASRRSPLLAHQLLWNMKTNKFRDEDGKVEDPDIGHKIDKLEAAILKSFTEGHRAFYKRQFQFSYELTEISHKIKPKNKDNGDRKVACLEEIQKIVIPKMVYLPSNPGCLVLGINRKLGIPLQSAAKAPYLTEFKVAKVGVEKLERICTGQEEFNEQETPTFMQKAIFKAGDDCRQDMLALQIIQLFQNAFNQVGLDVYLFPYKVVATSPGYGIIECIPDAASRQELLKQSEMTLLDLYKFKYGDKSDPLFQEKRRNYIKSMAAYSLVLYILQIKDRHNGNIMIDKEGHLLHIDFGFMFESSPGGNMGFEPDMKLTQDLISLMGGSMDTEEFKWFIDMTTKAYLAVRPFQENIVSLVTLMLGTGLPCFLGQTIKQLRSRFYPTMTDKGAALKLKEVIAKSFLSTRSKTYDMIQLQQQGIMYAT